MGFSNRCRDGVGFSRETGSTAVQLKAEIFIHTDMPRTLLCRVGVPKGAPSVVVGGVDSQA